MELEEEEDSELLSDQQTAQWPPTPLLAGHLKEAGKSILVNRSLRSEESFTEERKPKTVHFADGIRPGEGTSPSAGEELTSPPPPEQKLPKEKRYKKLKFSKKSLKKKKVKVCRSFFFFIYLFLAYSKIVGCQFQIIFKSG